MQIHARMSACSLDFQCILLDFFRRVFIDNSQKSIFKKSAAVTRRTYHIRILLLSAVYSQTYSIEQPGIGVPHRCIYPCDLEQLVKKEETRMLMFLLTLVYFWNVSCHTFIQNIIYNYTLYCIRDQSNTA